MTHGHSHGSKKSDGWTKLGTLGEAITSLVSDAYWMAGLVSACAAMATGPAEAGGDLNVTTAAVDVAVDIIGLPLYAVIAGAVGAVLSAGGAAYCHNNLNTHLQSVEGDHEKHDEATADPHGDCLVSVVDNEGFDDDVIDCYHPLSERNGVHESEVAVPAQAAGQKSSASLSWVQWLALAGDGISHTGDMAGPITFVVNLATANSPLPPLGKGLVQLGATVFGGLSSVANVRACKNALIESMAVKAVDLSHEHSGHERHGHRNHRHG